MAAVAATLAAWSPEGDLWLASVLDCLRSNRDHLAQWVAGPAVGLGVRGYPPEGTYLMWLDFRRARLASFEDPAAKLAAESGVLLGSGPEFGPGGAGFARLNFATSPGVLGQILERLEAALA